MGESAGLPVGSLPGELALGLRALPCSRCRLSEELLGCMGHLDASDPSECCTRLRTHADWLSALDEMESWPWVCVRCRAATAACPKSCWDAVRHAWATWMPLSRPSAALACTHMVVIMSSIG